MKTLAVCVGAQLRGILPCMPREDSLDVAADAHELVGLQDQVGDRPAALTGGLMQHDPRVRQDGALARGSAASMTAPTPIACPTHVVAISGRTCCIVS